jgi:serine/threonine protein kinase
VYEIDVRYKNLKPIGSGSYGIVCSANDTITGQKVAIKKISNVFEDLIDAKRILREIKLLRHLGDHENVIHILDIMTMPPNIRDFTDFYIVTECYECDLDRIISSSQTLTDGHNQYFLYQILRGMKYVHSGNVLHRDLKPSNILVNANCDLALCDFGLARGVTSELELALTEYVVTRWYRAPELLCDNVSYGKAVDVWSIGCIFAEILCRKPLLQGKDYMHQLRLITKLLGKPKPEDMEFIQNPDALKALQNLEGAYEPRSFTKLFPGANPQALDLLKKMLCFNPRKRCSVDEALAHPYLSELHRESDEPTCSSHFNFDFERNYPEEMPKNVLQEHMYMEMKKLLPMAVEEEETPLSSRSRGLDSARRHK